MFSTTLFFALILPQLSFLQAEVVRYTLEVYYFTGSPDGVFQPRILGINGQFPGPTLEANLGDIFEITLINSIQDGQNTTLHWHGFHQKASGFQDGTSMISQCPLPSGSSMVYRFEANQPGTYWYHSHVGSQYTEGLLGAMIVHGRPEAYKYDGEATLILSDWYHQSGHENEAWQLSPKSRGIPPYPNSGLINGMGRYPCGFAKRQNRTCDMQMQLRPVIRIQRGMDYRLRLINAAAISAFNFSIDQNVLKVIEVDSVDVAEPVAANIVPIASGQRYSFLIRCPEVSLTEKDQDTQYLIRADLRKEALPSIEGHGNINQYPEALMSDLSAVLECTGEDLSRSKNRVEIRREKFTYKDVLPTKPDGSEATKLVLDEMKLKPRNGIPAPDFFDEDFTVSVHFQEDHEDIRRGSFNNSPFSLPEDKPLLMKLLDGDEVSDRIFPLEIRNGSVVQLVINNPFEGPHPFHLHGHHFWVLGIGEEDAGNYEAGRDQLRVDGVRRDTVVVNGHSWVVLRFVADNPGIWIFHCHIDWHVLTGMALTFVEGREVLKEGMEKVPEDARRVCEMHGAPPENFFP